MTFTIAVAFVGIVTLILVVVSYLAAQQNIEKLPDGDELGQMIELQIAARMRDIYKYLIVLFLISAPYLNINLSESSTIWWIAFLGGSALLERGFRIFLLKKYVPK